MISPIKCMASLIIHTLLTTTWHTADALFCGMACNSWTMASIRFCTFSGWCSRCRIRLERIPQVCSIGVRSGELVGQFITLIHSSWKEVMDTRAVWARALCCITMNTSLAPACYLTICSMISLRCIAFVIPPLANTCRSVRPSNGISIQTMVSPHRTGQRGQCYCLCNVLPGVPTP